MYHKRENHCQKGGKEKECSAVQTARSRQRDKIYILTEMALDRITTHMGKVIMLQ
jgi:hypothetical protein